jgi:DNA-binding response OmpR family regulator
MIVVKITRTRLLIIGDDPLIAETIEDYFLSHEYETFTAARAREGLECFFLQRPDAVIVDLGLSQSKGLEVLSQVALESPETPVLIVSGSGSQQDAIEALRLGAWDYVPKPIEDIGILEYRVQRCLERARQLAERRQYREGLEREVSQRDEAIAAIKHSIEKTYGKKGDVAARREALFQESVQAERTREEWRREVRDLETGRAATEDTAAIEIGEDLGEASEAAHGRGVARGPSGRS